MKNFYIILFLLYLIFFIKPASISAQQNWNSLGSGLDSEVRCFYEDTVDKILYIGGSFRIADGDTVSGIAKWDDVNFSPLGCGMDYGLGSFPNATVSIIRYNDKLFATGGFLTAGGITVTGIAKWDGVSWSGFGDGLKYYDGTEGGGNNLTIFNNELYLVGSFDSINGIEAHSLAKYDGANWSAVHSLPVLNSDINFIWAIAFFNNEIYIGGGLNNSSLGINSLVKWDGNNWIAVPGFYGGMSSISKMCIYKNKLYVAGTFSKNGNPNNPGNYIAAWDGSTWSDVGGGVLGLYGFYNGQIADMIVHNDILYVVGVFQTAGGVTAQYIAKWDGTDWCGLGSTFDNVITAVGFYEDTLYIGGGFWTIDGDSMNYIAKWIGGSYVDTCGNSASINEVINKENNISLFPNPSDGNYTLQFAGNRNGTAEFTVFNILGKEVYSEKHKTTAGTNHANIDLTGFSDGIYLLRAIIDKNLYFAKIIKQ